MKSSHQTLPVSDRRIRTRIERCVRYVSNQTLTGLTEPDPFGFLKPNHIKKIGHKSITSGLWSRTKAATHTKRSYTHENHTNVNNHKTTSAVQPNEIKKATYEPTLTLTEARSYTTGAGWKNLKKWENLIAMTKSASNQKEPQTTLPNEFETEKTSTSLQTTTGQKERRRKRVKPPDLLPPKEREQPHVGKERWCWGKRPSSHHPWFKLHGGGKFDFR